MNLDQFLYQLHQLDVRWIQTPLGTIRCHNQAHVCCPITAIANRGSSPYGWKDDAKAIDLDLVTANAIVNAADNGESCDPIIRRKLLESCRLA